MAYEKFKIEGTGTESGTTVKTANSENIITGLVSKSVSVATAQRDATVVSNDASVSLTRMVTGSKNIYVSSNGTLVGTNVMTNDSVTQIQDVKSVTIHIDENGMQVAVRCSPVDLALTGS